LSLEGKRFERPLLRQLRLFDAPRQRGFLTVLVLGAQEPRRKVS
jgi:hypothetical protein